MRKFEGGATRDDLGEKFELGGFLSPLALSRFAAFMHRHRVTAGGVREAGNWKRGMPLGVYLDSAWRHFFAVWALLEGERVEAEYTDLEEELCALLFNVQGMLHEVMRGGEVRMRDSGGG